MTAVVRFVWTSETHVSKLPMC